LREARLGGRRCSFSMNARAPKRSSIRPLTARSSLSRSPSRRSAAAASKPTSGESASERTARRCAPARSRRARCAPRPRHDDLGREDLVVVEAHVDAGADQGRRPAAHRGAARRGAGLAPLAASRDAWRRFSMRFLT
jgi:hypothetical protein